MTREAVEEEAVTSCFGFLAEVGCLDEDESRGEARSGETLGRGRAAPEPEVETRSEESFQTK